MNQIPTYDLIKEDAAFAAHFYGVTIEPTSLRSMIATAVLQSCLQENPTTPAFYVIDAFFLKLMNVFDGGVLTARATAAHKEMIATLVAKTGRTNHTSNILKTMSTRSIKDLQGLNGIERVVVEALTFEHSYTKDGDVDANLMHNPIYLMHAGTGDQFDTWNYLLEVAKVVEENPTSFTSNFKELMRVCTEY